MAGLIATFAVALVGIVQLRAQRASQVSGDFRNATAAEIRDTAGQVLLRGTFAPADADEDDEVELVAKLEPATAGTNLSGEAEVEFQKSSPEVQEVELKLSGVQPGAELTFVIDAKTVTTAKANDKGAVDVELEVRAGAGQ